MKFRKDKLFLKTILILFCFLITISLLCNTSFAQDEMTEGQLEGEFGGTINVALTSSPPMLDVHITQVEDTAITTAHFLEPLIVVDSEYNFHNVLAESHEISEDAKTITFTLREGVNFHNGEEMTSADVVASLKRYIRLADRGALIANHMENPEEDVKAIDKYTVVMEFEKPFVAGLDLLARYSTGAKIIPEEQIEEYGDDRIEEPIGTGPYKLVEWEPGDFLRVERFEDYKSPTDEAPDGAAGRRTPYADEIVFWEVPDSAARFSGVQTGEYHYSNIIPTDMHIQAEEDENVEPVIKEPGILPFFKFNKKEGLMTDANMRKAVRTALDMNQILIAAAGEPQFWDLNHNWTMWETEAGAEYYNQADIEKAQEYLEEANYDGEEIRWIVSHEFTEHHMAVLAAEAQLERAGFNVDVRVYDWPTITEYRANPEVYDIFTSHHNKRLPSQLAFLPDDYPGWWVDDYKDELLTIIMGSPEMDERQEAWAELQRHMWEDHVPIITPGEIRSMSVKHSSLAGYELYHERPWFWNAWIED